MLNSSWCWFVKNNWVLLASHQPSCLVIIQWLFGYPKALVQLWWLSWRSAVDLNHGWMSCHENTCLGYCQLLLVLHATWYLGTLWILMMRSPLLILTVCRRGVGKICSLGTTVSVTLGGWRTHWSVWGFRSYSNLLATKAFPIADQVQTCGHGDGMIWCLSGFPRKLNRCIQYVFIHIHILYLGD